MISVGSFSWRRCGSHPLLRNSVDLQTFLEASEEIWSKETSIREQTGLSKRVDKMGTMFKGLKASLSIALDSRKPSSNEGESSNGIGPYQVNIKYKSAQYSEKKSDGSLQKLQTILVFVFGVMGFIYGGSCGQMVNEEEAYLQFGDYVSQLREILHTIASHVEIFVKRQREATDCLAKFSESLASLGNEQKGAI